MIASPPRRIHTLALVGLLVLIGGWSPATGQDKEDDSLRASKEIKRLWDETHKLHAAGKTVEAITAAQGMLAIARRFAGNDDPILATSLGWLAKLHVEREDFAAAKKARGEALDILRKRYGEGHWKAIDARMALDDVERQSKMDRDQLHRLAEAARLNLQGVELHQAGKFREAAEMVRRALALRKEVLGERHPDYATSLNNLASCSERRGTTPRRGRSTSRRWRSARRSWASGTPTTPPA